ncbi:MAG TPA: ATP-binding protein [Candidatus Kapabacteria bacterium]|nr:ATP-binding protein [Candidatus Kapabacteria bacterium]
MVIDTPLISEREAVRGKDVGPALHTSQTQIEDRRLFSELFDELGEAVLISDHTGRIVRVNKAAVRILGMSAERLRGLRHDDPIWQAVREDGTPLAASELPATKVLHTGKPISSMELGVVRPDGSLVWILESAAPILDESGEVSGVIVTFPDISVAVQQRQDLRELNEKYQLERDRANEANQLKSAFLANMSHEIRTPMTAILGFSDVLTSELAGKVQDHHYTFLRSINVSGRRLLALLNDILDLSKIEAGHVDVENSEVDVCAEVEACVTPLSWIAKQKSLAMNIEIYPERLIIKGDRHRFAQVMTNLVSNAIKFTHTGSISVRMSLVEDSRNLPAVGVPTQQVMIEVEDTGIGISSEFLPNLFEEFRQEHSGITKEFGGTGLGLAISQRLVTKMGGTIEARSKEGEGSIFTVRFPIVGVGRAPVVLKTESETEPAQDRTSIFELGPAKAGRKVGMPQAGKNHKGTVSSEQNLPHILVVEDNIETQRLIGAYLRDSYHLTSAHNAEEVWAALENDIPELILMDVNLPGRDGLSITREIRAGSQCPNVPIIALTAFAMAGDREKCQEAGCTGYLSKPATRREVRDAVHHFIGQ